MKRPLILLCVVMALCAVLQAAEPGGWVNLLASGSLDGWRTEGAADWRVADGVLIGKQGAKGEGGDLFSVKQWANFELEAEWTMKFPGNSGIWFRVGAPRTGYQADILDQPSHPGVLSGSLYCMGKAFIAENHDAATVNKTGWNKMRIVVEGNHIVIEQGGKKVVDIRDDKFPQAGSVGIQVHAGKAYEGMEVKVRNLRIRSKESK